MAGLLLWCYAMGKHSAVRRRRKPAVVTAAVVAPYALLLAAGGDVFSAVPGDSRTSTQSSTPKSPTSRRRQLHSVCGDRGSSTNGHSVDSNRCAGGHGFRARSVAPASRYRVYNREAERILPVGKPLSGASRSGPSGGPQHQRDVPGDSEHRRCSPGFAEVASQRSGARRDDPRPHQRRGIALGNRIVSFALENAKRFGLQDASGEACTTPPAARERVVTATMTTSTSPRTVADTPRGERSTSAELYEQLAKRGRR